MKITIETKGTVVIKEIEDMCSLPDVMDELRYAFIGVGFTEKTVIECLGPFN